METNSISQYVNIIEKKSIVREINKSIIMKRTPWVNMSMLLMKSINKYINIFVRKSIIY